MQAGQQTRIRDLMQENPEIISSECTLQEAARKMELIGCGVLPIGSEDGLEGVITDRDIVIRAVAKGKDITKEKVKNYMTKELRSVKKDETTAAAATVMRESNISRVLVKDENGKPCGILSFGRIIRENGNIREITNVIECAVGKKAA